MDRHTILKSLRESPPVFLATLPDAFGIYALWDHECQIRYIGYTPKGNEGFRIRVANKHVTGSEGRSHKFSQAYCTGRMWRFCKRLHPISALQEQDPSDANLAKKLRTAFIRRYCKATYVEVPKCRVSGDYFAHLNALESQVQQLAPPSMRAWEGIKFRSVAEPAELVCNLLKDMPEIQSAAERQREVYRKRVVGLSVDT